MSDFACTVERIGIEPHPNADRIEIAKVGGFRSIVQKGQFRDGDLAVYIPEFAVVPDWMLKSMGLWDKIKDKGSLSSAKGNRVKAIKLRGVLSQGLIWPCGVSIPLDTDMRPTGGPHEYFISSTPDLDPPVGAMVMVVEGQDVAADLGITKWEPPIPSHMAGRIAGADLEATFGYDFDNIKKKPDLFTEGDPVVMTEKIHGTLLQIGVVPTRMGKEKYYKGRVVLSSKGLGRQGYIFDHTDDSNLYVQAAKKFDLFEKMLDTFGAIVEVSDKPIWIFCEIFGVTPSGKVVQDLTYGGEEVQLRIFDAAVGPRSDPAFLEWMSLQNLANKLGVKIVPPLFVGKFTAAALEQHTNGAETISGNASHMREGVVVKCLFEIEHPKYGRRIAKSISEQYLLRKGDTTENT